MCLGAGAPAPARGAAGRRRRRARALSERARAESARLMRVNHAGEVAAQALYRGQALTARDAGSGRRHAPGGRRGDRSPRLVRRADRGSSTAASSLLNPLWYAGSFLIGALAGALGRSGQPRVLAETERQVESHLRDHLDRLPPADRRSRAILAADEARRDRSTARRRPRSGGKDLPRLGEGSDAPDLASS